FDRLDLDPARHAYIASPLSRAVETMRIVRGELGFPDAVFPTDPRLIELGFGRWAGLDIHEVAAADPHGHAAREADRWNARPPGGESMADGAARVTPLLAAIDGPTVLVTHGGLIRVIHVLLGAAEVSATRHLPTPQDRFHVIHRGAVEWV
ncbi:MAG TPA: histidine phosphatase family protein, partial [Methylomirabilota bacterium]|nr:histidine phosphatase family protein [Methylomirabilota bacterium]